jgi:hypothetical protein
MLSMLDLERFRNTPLINEPFEFLIMPEFVKAERGGRSTKITPR